MALNDRANEGAAAQTRDGSVILSQAANPPLGARPELPKPRAEAASLPKVDLSSQQTEVTLMSGGEQRKLYIHRPANYDANKAAPLILVFNGYDSNPNGGAANMGKFTGLSKAGDANGYIVAYLDGAGPDHTWALYGKHNDGAFASDALKYLEKNYAIDAKRVFAAAFSDGGTGMIPALRALGGQVAAVAGDKIYMTGPEAALTTPTSALIIEGLDDLYVPPAGTSSMVSDGVERFVHGELKVGTEEVGAAILHPVLGPHMEPTQQIVDYFRSADQTSAPPQTVHNGQMTSETYASGRNGTEVEVVLGAYQGHGWGGSTWRDTPTAPPKIVNDPMLGANGAPLDDTTIIMDFFNHHPKE